MLGLADNKKVVIVGIPGVGKTSLVTKLVELIIEQNKTVGVHSFGTVMPVSYTHLTLPTNREV